MLVHIIGTRPQYIKAAVVIKALNKAGIATEVIDTGQHYNPEMSTEIWKNFGLETPSSLSPLPLEQRNNTEAIANALINNLQNLQPHGIIVYGDTNSAMAGAIAANHFQLPLIHIEAGLRSFNDEMPEERNRKQIDNMSAVLFCSSTTGVENLQKEEVKGKIILSGDVMYDAFLLAKTKTASVQLHEILPEEIIMQPYILLTVHRKSNTDNLKNFEAIISAMEEAPYKVIWPVHPRNKHVKEYLQHSKNIYTLPPQDYFTMQALLKHARYLFTDSGGLQKEAYWWQVPCITLRNETEWIETLDKGWNTLAGTNKEAIKKSFEKTPDKKTWRPLYGENACEIITTTLLQYELNGYPVI